MKKLNVFAVLVVFALAGCGREKLGSKAKSRPATPETPATDVVSVETPAVETTAEVVPTSVPLETYEKASATLVTGALPETMAILSDLNLASNALFNPSLYNKGMKGAYYFARVTKFRLPEDAEPGEYTWILSVSPQSVQKGKMADKAAFVEVGPISNLIAGDVGAGSQRVIPLPSDEISTLGGYWNEDAVIQVSIVKVNRDAIANKRAKTLSEAFPPVIIANKTVDFDAYNENKTQLSTFSTQKEDGSLNAVIEVKFWKGNKDAKSAEAIRFDSPTELSRPPRY